MYETSDIPRRHYIFEIEYELDGAFLVNLRIKSFIDLSKGGQNISISL